MLTTTTACTHCKESGRLLFPEEFSFAQLHFHSLSSLHTTWSGAFHSHLGGGGGSNILRTRSCCNDEGQSVEFLLLNFRESLCHLFFSDFLASRIHWMKKNNNKEQRLVSVKFQNLKKKQWEDFCPVKCFFPKFPVKDGGVYTFWEN